MRITRAGDAAEGGAQGIHSNYESMLGLIDRYGLTQDLTSTGGKAAYLDRTGATRISGSNRDLAGIIGPRGVADLAFFWTRYFALAKPFAQFEINKDIPEYDDISTLDAFSWAGKNFWDYVLKPMTCAMANSEPEHVNLYYIINGLKLRMTTHILGLKGGNVSLLERMAETVPVRYGASVKSLLSTGGVADGVMLEDGTSIKAKHVIMACTAGAAGSILNDDFRSVRPFLLSFPHTPMPLAFFFLDRPIKSAAYASFGHPYRDARFNLSINHAIKAPHLVPSGKALISAWPTFPGAVELAAKPDSEIIRLALNDVEAFYPGIRGWIEEARVMRHDWGVARYSPGMHKQVLNFKDEAARFRGLSFAGTDFDSLHMESGVRSGLRAARRALIG